MCSPPTRRWVPLLLACFVVNVICDESTVESKTDTVTPIKKSLHVNVLDVAGQEEVFFEEQFRDVNSIQNWITSKAKRPDTSDDLAMYDGKWDVEVPEGSSFNDDYALALKSPARHHAISAKLQRPFNFAENSKLIVQYEVKFAKSPECSGAYVKLLFDDTDLENFNSQSNYSIMFGPDKCGMNQKCHFIVRFKNPISNVFTEHHGQGNVVGSLFGDQQTHLFRLELSQNQYRVLIDNSVMDSGNLLKDLTPPIIPSKEIDDPNDSKPEDWDEREKIDDETSTKPDDWDEDAPMEIPDESQTKPDFWLDDEPELIPDTKAEKPADYDEDLDGIWEPPLVDNEKCMRDGQNICGQWKPPMIPNPNFRGKWRAPMIDNPNYKGKWVPRKIANPDYFELTDSVFSQLHSIGAVGLELWSMTDNIFFDNFVVSQTSTVPDQFLNRLWKEKSKAEIPTGLTKFETIMFQASKRPYLSATIVIAIFIVVVAIIGRFMQPKRDAAVGESKKTDAEVEDDDVINDLIDLDESPRKNDVNSNVNQDAAHNGDVEEPENLIKHRNRSSSRKRKQNGISSNYEDMAAEERE